MVLQVPVAPRGKQCNQGPTSQMEGGHRGGASAHSEVTETGVQVPAGAPTEQVPSPLQASVSPSVKWGVVSTSVRW